MVAVAGLGVVEAGEEEPLAAVAAEPAAVALGGQEVAPCGTGPPSPGEAAGTGLHPTAG